MPDTHEFRTYEKDGAAVAELAVPGPGGVRKYVAVVKPGDIQTVRARVAALARAHNDRVSGADPDDVLPPSGTKGKSPSDPDAPMEPSKKQPAGKKPPAARVSFGTPRLLTAQDQFYGRTPFSKVQDVGTGPSRWRLWGEDDVDRVAGMKVREILVKKLQAQVPPDVLRRTAAAELKARGFRSVSRDGRALSREGVPSVVGVTNFTSPRSSNFVDDGFREAQMKRAGDGGNHTMDKYQHDGVFGTAPAPAPAKKPPAPVGRPFTKLESIVGAVMDVSRAGNIEDGVVYLGRRRGTEIVQAEEVVNPPEDALFRETLLDEESAAPQDTSVSTNTKLPDNPTMQGWGTQRTGAVRQITDAASSSRSDEDRILRLEKEGGDAWQSDGWSLNPLKAAKKLGSGAVSIAKKTGSTSLSIARKTGSVATGAVKSIGQATVKLAKMPLHAIEYAVNKIGMAATWPIRRAARGTIVSFASAIARKNGRAKPNAADKKLAGQQVIARYAGAARSGNPRLMSLAAPLAFSALALKKFGTGVSGDVGADILFDARCRKAVRMAGVGAFGADDALLVGAGAAAVVVAGKIMKPAGAPAAAPPPGGEEYPQEEQYPEEQYAEEQYADPGYDQEAYADPAADYYDESMGGAPLPRGTVAPKRSPLAQAEYMARQRAARLRAFLARGGRPTTQSLQAAQLAARYQNYPAPAPAPSAAPYVPPPAAYPSYPEPSAPPAGPASYPTPEFNEPVQGPQYRGPEEELTEEELAAQEEYGE